MVDGFKALNKPEFDLASKMLIQILDDLDTILSTNKHFLLGNWIESAKSLANSDQVFVKFKVFIDSKLWGFFFLILLNSICDQLLFCV